LFVRSLHKLTQLDPGFREAGVVMAHVDYRKAGIAAQNVGALTRQVIDRLHAVPGVDAVAEAFTTPVGGNFWNQNVVIDGMEKEGNVNFNSVGSEYFRAIGTPLVAGRAFDNHDTPQSALVAIVNEAFARKY